MGRGSLETAGITKDESWLIEDGSLLIRNIRSHWRSQGSLVEKRPAAVFRCFMSTCSPCVNSQTLYDTYLTFPLDQAWSAIQPMR